MFQNHHFEKVSSGDACVPPQIARFPMSWKARGGIGNAFAFLFLAVLMLGGTGQATAEGARPLLNLNQATSAQLEGLPGIGAVKAAAILAVRDAQGGFDSMEQLESVRGIGPALVTKLRPLVSLGQSGSRTPATSTKTSAKRKASAGSAAKTSAGAPKKSAK